MNTDAAEGHYPEDDDSSTAQPIDEDPESLVGEDIHNVDRSTFPEDAQFTDEQWAFVDAVVTKEA